MSLAAAQFALPTIEADCKVCAKPFARRSTLQSTCIACVLAAAKVRDKQVAKAQRQAAIDERKAFRARKDAAKPRSEWMRDAQAAFNAWVKVRDAGQPCISCDETNPPMTPGGQWDAGHWKSRGSHPELKFHPDNCHKQCKKCNGGSGKFAHKARTVSDQYRERLIKRIGLAAVEALEGPHPPAHWSVDDLKAIKTKYRARARALTKEMA